MLALRFAFCIALLTTGAFAQNTFPASGNVGIGQTSPWAALNVLSFAGTTQSNISQFVNGTNGAYTSMTGVGTESIVGTWSNGSQVVEFVPFSTGNGIVSSYTGNLLFQTNERTNRMVITSTGNVGIGTTSPGTTLEINGNVTLTAGSGASMTYPDGTIQSTAWNGVLSGGDYAESVNISGDREEYEPGDVLVIDPTSEGKFLKSSAPYSTAVTGIYSTRPGVVGRRQLTARAHMKEEVPMAMTGIVPTKVSAENGQIKPGDLLVTSSKPGYAMKGTDRTQMLGAVIGKAIGHLDSGIGVIEAVVTLQ
jgi:hypothetical protein